MSVIIRRDELKQNLFQKIFGIIPEIKPIIAKKDIVVYKWYLETDLKSVVKSPYMLNLYLVGKLLPKVDIGVDFVTSNKAATISEGYHSFVLESSVDHFKSTVQYKCIIPKGSIYYANETNIVSNQLIVLNPINVIRR